MRRAAAAGVLFAALLGAGCAMSGFHRKPRIAVVDGDPLVQMASPEDFRSAIDPPTVIAVEHPDPPDGDDAVLGLDAEGAARSYPIGLLDRVEVINESANGKAWVVARCALTDVAAAYDRSVDGRTLTFENHGALWRDTAVMRDRETGTYWTAATGRGLAGPLAGRWLSPVPAVLTSSADWLRAFPSARIPDLAVPTSVPLSLRLYAASPWQGISGVKTHDHRYSAKKRFLSVARGAEVLAFTAEEIRRSGRVETSLGGAPILLTWDARVDAARAWEGSGEGARELAVVPMYWFALDRHFETIHTLH